VQPFFGGTAAPWNLPAGYTYSENGLAAKLTSSSVESAQWRAGEEDFNLIGKKKLARRSLWRGGVYV